MSKYFITDGSNSATNATFDPVFRNSCGITREEISEHLGHYLTEFSESFNRDYEDKSTTAFNRRMSLIYPTVFHGYLTEEQEDYIGKLINATKKMTEKDVLDILAIYYNNITYCFEDTKKIFNIWSVTLTFENLKIGQYWVGSSQDINVYLRSSDVILYFKTSFKLDNDYAIENKITQEDLKDYTESDLKTSLHPTYKQVLIRFYFLGLSSITSRTSNNKKLYYLYPSCLEARQVLESRLSRSLNAENILCRTELQNYLNEFIKFENISLRLESVMKAVSVDPCITNETSFSEPLISERFASHLRKSFKQQGTFIEVVHQKNGNLEIGKAFKKIDVCVVVKRLDNPMELNGVAIIEFKKEKQNDRSITSSNTTADGAIACILSRGYHKLIQFRNVKNILIVGINVITRDSKKEDDPAKIGETIIYHKIKGLRIKDSVALEKLDTAYEADIEDGDSDETRITKMKNVLRNFEDKEEYNQWFEILKTNTD